MLAFYYIIPYVANAFWAPCRKMAVNTDTSLFPGGSTSEVFFGPWSGTVPNFMFVPQYPQLLHASARLLVQRSVRQEFCITITLIPVATVLV